MKAQTGACCIPNGDNLTAIGMYSVMISFVVTEIAVRYQFSSTNCIKTIVFHEQDCAL